MSGGKPKAAWAAKAEWMSEWAKICSKCGHPASPVAGIVPFDASGQCFYCRNNMTPTEKPPRHTVKP